MAMVTVMATAMVTDNLNNQDIENMQEEPISV